MNNIMIVEDDKMLNNGITFNLKMDNFNVISTFSIKEGKNALKNNLIDLIILDINLPDGSGFEFCKEIRKENNIPILFLTACDNELDIITGFKIGADDYITKPFSLNILRERIFALLRRCGKNTNESNLLKVDGFEIDLDKMTLSKNGELIELSPTEYKLLKKLITLRGNVITRDKLLDELWEKDNFIEEHALTVNINRLRSKIEDNPSKPKFIKTVYGIGYSWVGEDNE